MELVVALIDHGSKINLMSLDIHRKLMGGRSKRYQEKKKNLMELARTCKLGLMTLNWTTLLCERVSVTLCHSWRTIYHGGLDESEGT